VTPAEANTGWKIGPYRVTGLLSRTAAASFYSAVRDDAAYEREFVVELAHEGSDGERTRAQRQILAELEHPNIAALLDGGVTADGLPYLVLERVHGLPITEYCSGKLLSLTERLYLFLKVCNTVQHAHQRLVVHTELTPGNILITPAGEPKLVNFGIGALLGSAGHTTHTTAGDIIALGEILGAMMTGRKKQEDLDSIAAKARQSEKDRGYGSVQELAQDIRRYMHGLPVTARQNTVSYRTSRFLRRRRWPLAAGFAILVSLAAAAVITNRQARRAEQRYQQVRQLANSFLFEFHDSIQPLPGSMDTRKAVVQTALDYLSRLQQDAEGDDSLQRDIATAYEKIGDVQGYPFGDNLGESSAALASYRKAFAIKTRIDSPRRTLGGLLLKIGDVELALGRTPAALESFRKGLEFAEQARLDSAEEDLLLGSAYLRIGQIYAVRGDAPAALNSYRTSSEHYSNLCARAATAANLNLHAMSLQRVGYALIWTGQIIPALDAYRRAIAVSRKAVGADPDNNAYLRNLALNYISLGDLLGSPFHINLGNRVAAMEQYRMAADLAQQMVDRFPKDAQARISLNQTRSRLAYILAKTDPAEGLKLCQQALASNASLLENDSANTEYRRERGFHLLGIGYMHEKLGNMDLALSAYRDSLGVQQALTVDDSSRTQFRQDTIPTRLFMGRGLIRLGRKAEARTHIVAALRLAESQYLISPHNLYSIRNLSDCYEAMAALEESAGWGEKNVDLWIAWEAGHAPNPYSTSRRKRASLP